MDSVQQHFVEKLQDGRKGSLFRATAELNRRGAPIEEVISTVGRKSIEADGLDQRFVEKLIRQTYSQYCSEHGTKADRLALPVGSNGIRAQLRQEIDEDLIDLDLDHLLPLPSPSGNGKEDFTRYVQALFRPGDHISIDLEPTLDRESQRYAPAVGQTVAYEQVLNFLISGKNPGFVPTTQGYCPRPGGAFIRINPVLRGGGSKCDDDVQDYRYVLIESDHLPLEIQLTVCKLLNLPTKAIVHSGGRSLHIIVKIDAGRNFREFKRRVAFLHRVLSAALYKFDPSTGNPSRWSRMPGYQRQETRHDEKLDAPQYLVGTDIGAESWEAWEPQAIELLENIPAPIAADRIEDTIEIPEELIEGILRRGGKFLIGGPSKSGKSMKLIQLGHSLAHGLPWLGFSCHKSRVLYCNMEVSAGECGKRVMESSSKLGITPTDAFQVLNLDQADTTLESLVKVVGRRARQQSIDVIIIDPIYTLIGNEVDAGETKKLTRAISQISSQCNATVIYAHHNNKGIANDNRTGHIDRLSGSGVLARGPDAIMTYALRGDKTGKAYFTLRGFAEPDPLELKFEYPLFSLQTAASLGGNNMAPISVPALRPSGRPQKLSGEILDAYLTTNPGATPQDLVRDFGVSKSTAYDRLKARKLQAQHVTLE